MRFSEQFCIKKDGSEEWFDLLLNQDTPFYVDPLLVFDDNDEFWADAKEEVVKFFEYAVGLAIKSGGNKNQYWNSAIDALRCPEPNQFCLGLSTGNPKGSGLGKKSAELMCESLSTAEKSKIVDFSMILGFMIFVPNVGVDVISDCICNILKKKFIEYTQKVCRDLSIGTDEFLVRNAGFDSTRGVWRDGRFQLPANPYNGSYSLLVPKRFLAEIPSKDEGYEYIDAIDHNQELRNRFNLEINKNLTRSKKIALIRAALLKSPEEAIKFIKEYNQENPKAPYNIDEDPDGLFRWYEDGIKLAGFVDKIREPEGRNIEEFVINLAHGFKHAVEEQGGWKLLWDEGREKHRKEDIVQSLAGMMWRYQCKVANIDINREIETGRGPVDFKFSSGWEERVLLEVKHLDSRAFLTGLKNQTLQYLKSDQSYIGVYLVIQYEETVLMDNRIQEINNEVQRLRAEGKRLTVVFVNASPNKKSASKLK